MGTNYYVRKNIPIEEIKELKNLITPENIYNDVIKSYLDKYKEIHIGKSSCGWQFLFNHNNGDYYEKTKKSINDFLKKTLDDGGSFVDEYGDSITIEEFWKMVEEKKEGLTAEKAYQEELKKYEDYKSHSENYIEEHHNIPHYPHTYAHDPYETITEEGLRFSSSTEFC